MSGLVVVYAIVWYLVGSIPFGLLVGRLVRGVDIREYGSGSTGTTNALRTLGKGPALAVLLLDVLKGAAPVLIAKLVADDPWLQVVGALAAIIGHDFPVFAGFRGGRGVASSFGATLAMVPLLGIFLPFLGGLILIPFRYVSLMSVLATSVAAVMLLALAWTDRVPDAYASFAIVGGTLIVVLHRGNIGRLLAGTEPKLGQGGQKRSGAKV